MTFVFSFFCLKWYAIESYGWLILTKLLGFEFLEGELKIRKNGGHIAGIELRLSIALPRPPPACLWEVPQHHPLVVRGDLARA